MGPGRRRPSRTQSYIPKKENQWGVGFGRWRPPAKQQCPEARGNSAQLRPMESGGPGAKTACVDFLQRGTVRLWFVAQGEFPFAECSSQKLVLGLQCNGASALSGRAGSRGMAGAGRRRLSRAEACFPTKENPWGVGFGRQRPPVKQQGPGSQGRPSPALPYGERRAGGEKSLC